jgi:hypothetical protein
MVDPLLQSTLEMRHALRTTSKSHLLAEIIPSFPADCALTARNADFESDTVADVEAIDGWADSYDDTGRFMAKGQWCAST